MCCPLTLERLITEDQVDILLGPYSSGLALQSRRNCSALAACAVESWWRFPEAIYTRGFAWVVGILSPPSTYFHSVIDFVQHTRPPLLAMSPLSTRRLEPFPKTLPLVPCSIVSNRYSRPFTPIPILLGQLTLR